MRICVIGAGPSGLISTKHAKEHGHECVVFEQNGTLGGMWNYTEVEENGLSIHSSIYRDLRTIIPKEVMALKGFPYPDTIKEAYITQPQVLDYFHKFSQHFNLNPLINYFQKVVKVKPLPADKWEVTINHLKSNLIETKEFDAVMVCNGVFHTPSYPNIPGKEIFKGIQGHSHTYRVPETYEGKTVLVIGANTSGLDISKKISAKADHVYLSHRKGQKVGGDNPKITEKPEVVRIFENEVEFKGGDRQKVDAILYCTGYLYSYPFLSEECKIRVDDNWIQYLYKHLVNIEFPTMFFIGVITVIPIMQTMDMQVRFALQVLEKKISLPSKCDMLDDILKWQKHQNDHGLSQKYFHQIGFGNERDYFGDLAAIGKIEPVREVLLRIYTHCVNTGRKHHYRIIDDEHFEVIK